MSGFFCVSDVITILVFTYFFIFPAVYHSPQVRERILNSDSNLEEYMSQQITPTLPATGFLRLNQVLQFIPVKKTRWYRGLQTGEFPQPVPLGARARGYRVEDIRALIQRLGSQSAGVQ